MASLRTKPLESEWKERLGLANRKPPQLYESSSQIGEAAHAVAIRTALETLGLSAIHCIQGTPTVAILRSDEYDRARVLELHAALWNQGLASLLLVIADDALRAFSLARKPLKDSEASFEQRCLVTTLRHTADALEFRNLIYGAESGRLWKDFEHYFRPEERIDQVLLDNLTASHDLLCKADLSSAAAQALLIQAMFIAYLEDRAIITCDYFRDVSLSQCDSFLSLLATRNTKLLRSLFSGLRGHFNGDLFVAPCSFEPKARAPEIKPVHLDVLAAFRSGREEMGQSGQQRFWGYNFRYIPIELVSAVYDRFLGEQKEERKEQGAYYTPMFLADSVVSQAWQFLSRPAKESGQFLDPACGSGVFLVRTFQQLCEHWRHTHRSHTIRWNSLLSILQRVHGWDINGSAVRVAVFSLYVALLEEVSPPDIRQLISEGRILPELWGRTMRCQDFFSVPAASNQFDVLIGNPPWTSRRGPSRRLSVRWCEQNGRPMPGNEDAWAFAWKAIEHLTGDGLVAFLVPAMGFLHNNAAQTIRARNLFVKEIRIRRIINFADLRFQLFKGAISPAALVIYERKPLPSYQFEYWCPKADVSLRLKRTISLTSADRSCLSSTTVLHDPLALKQRLWMREPDAKLFSFLSRFPKIGDRVVGSRGVKRASSHDPGPGWVIGQGFQPHHGDGKPLTSRLVGKLPYLPIEAFERLAQPTSDLSTWRTSRVRRKGFEAGFTGARILIPQGVETSQLRLRATYIEDPVTFQHSIQAISVPAGQENHAKVLTALLNSRVAVWYAFHGTGSYGAERDRVLQSDLLRLPFPDPADLPDRGASADAAAALIDVVNRSRLSINTRHFSTVVDDTTLKTVDKLAYRYFGLSAEEEILIEDAAEYIIPAVQPHEGAYPRLWKAPLVQERRAYATALAARLRTWLRRDQEIGARLEACSADLGIVSLSLNARTMTYDEKTNASLTDVLASISRSLPQPLAENFQLLPDLRIFVGQSLYLIKPMQMRFWLRSSALADADAIALDLQDAARMVQPQSSH